MTQQEDSTNTVEVQQQEPTQTTNDVVSNESILSNNKVEEPVASESNPSLVEQPSSELVVEEVKREETVVEEEEKKEVMPDDQVEEVKTEVHDEQAPPVQPSTEVEQVAEKEESTTTTTTTEAPSVVEQSTLVVEEVAPQDNTAVNVSDVVLTETTIVETVVVQPVASEEKIEVVPQPSTETIVVEAKESQQQTTAATAFVKDSNIDENSHYGVKLKVETRAPKVDVKKQSVDIGGGIRRKATDTDGLVYRKNANIATCYDSLQNAIKKYPNNKALGHRPIVNGVAGDYVWMTYSQLGERLANFSSGLVNLGIQPKQHIGIYSKNRPEWQIASEGSFCQSLVTISLYDTLGEESSKFIINHGELVAICCSGETFPKVLKLLPDCPLLKLVISFDPISDAEKQSAEQAGIKVHTIDEVEKLGKEKPVAPVPPTQFDLMSIMYTSGTTGTPKGVMLTHRNMIAVASGVASNIESGGKALDQTDVLISYLPLAHILQRAAESVFLSLGSQIGYFQGNILKLPEDFVALKPTLLTSVPRVLDRLYDKLTSTVNSASNFRKNLFAKALNSKKKAQGGRTFIWDALVFKKVRATLGGKVRGILCGGAPLRPEVQETLACALCCPIFQGYGLTETCAAGTLQIPGDFTFSNVGCPLASMEIKLLSVPEMDYNADAEVPTGEVLMRGPAVSQGYFKDPVKTAEEFDADGFFHTGDIGRWNPNGTLSIIDRKKALFKLSQGEYISPEALEAKFSTSPFVSRVWVYGNSLKSVLVAVGVIDKAQTLRLAQEAQLENATEEKFAELIAGAAFKNLVLKSFDAIAVDQKLQGFEKIKDIRFVTEDFDIIDCVTPTQKLQRNKLQKHFQQQIDEMYAELEKPQQ